jgi:hypothetical protein
MPPGGRVYVGFLRDRPPAAAKQKLGVRGALEAADSASARREQENAAAEEVQ